MAASHAICRGSKYKTTCPPAHLGERLLLLSWHKEALPLCWRVATDSTRKYKHILKNTRITVCWNRRESTSIPGILVYRMICIYVY